MNAQNVDVAPKLCQNGVCSVLNFAFLDEF